MRTLSFRNEHLPIRRTSPPFSRRGFIILYSTTALSHYFFFFFPLPSSFDGTFPQANYATGN